MSVITLQESETPELRSNVRTESIVVIKSHDWPHSPMARALSRAFTPPPAGEIWEWADQHVLLQNEDAAEPGSYRSAKTPWTRRLQELMRRPEMWVWSWTANRYVRVPVTEVDVMKSSQSGFSEAALNGIRWRATYRPCNVIYAIDSADEAKKIARRLLRSLRYLDQTIFTGNPDDIKSLEFQLRGMELWFIGSFSTGKAANKQAPLVVTDEVEEHGKNILGDLDSRKKTSTGGIQINLSKPKLKNGPIHRLYKRGNQEEFFVPCPHCGHLQFLTFFPEEREVPFSEEFVWINTETGENFTKEELRIKKDENPELHNSSFIILPSPLPLGEKRKLKTGRFVFEHCRNLLGEWDRLRVQTDTYYECAACQGRIEEHHKRGMMDRGQWLPMEINAEPGVVSQHMTDFLGEEEMNAFGRIANKYIEARHETYRGKRSLEGKSPLQDFYNHRCGKVWSEEAVETQPKDITENIAGRPLWFVDGPNREGQIVRNVFTDSASAERLAAGNKERHGEDSPVIHSACPPYRRGTIPFVPFRNTMIGGADVGGAYAVWVAIAIHQNLEDAAVIDWGDELDPDAVLQMMQEAKWPVRARVGEIDLAIHGTEASARIRTLWMDSRWRARDVYAAALASRRVIIPCRGLGGAVARSVKLWSDVAVPSYPGLRELHFNDQRAKDALYLHRIKRKLKRLWFPVDVQEDPDFIDQICAEKQKQDRAGRFYWPDESEGPNHKGDALKLAVLGYDYQTRTLKPGVATALKETEKAATD